MDFGQCLSKGDQLLEAAFDGNFLEIKRFIDAGLTAEELNKKNTIGMTALMMAAQKGYGNIAILLIGAKPNLDSQDDNGYSALMHAINQNQEIIACMLITARANISLKSDRDGETAMSLAQKKAPDILRMLNTQLLPKQKQSYLQQTSSYLGAWYEVMPALPIPNRPNWMPAMPKMPKALSYSYWVTQKAEPNRSEMELKTAPPQPSPAKRGRGLEKIQ